MIPEETWKNAFNGEAFKRGVILRLCRGHFCFQFLSLEGTIFMTWHFYLSVCAVFTKQGVGKEFGVLAIIRCTVITNCALILRPVGSLSDCLLPLSSFLS